MLKSYRSLRVFGISVILSTAFFAVEAQNLQVAIAAGEFQERLDKHGRVSGDIVVGVMIGPADVAKPMADLAPRFTADVAVNLPPTTGTQDYCVRINSKDGRFESENTYPVAGASSSAGLSFRYDGIHASALTSMKAVSLVKLGPCGDRTEVIVPSIWADTSAKPKGRALHVFVNSAGNPTGVAVGSDPGFMECKDVADATTLKYTAACVLPFDLLQAEQRDGNVNLTFFVTRSLGEEVFDLAIALPAVEG